MNNEIIEFIRHNWRRFGNSFKRKIKREMGDDEYKKLFSRFA